MPVSPAFALIPSCITARSKAFLCGRRCALSIRPTGGTSTRFHVATRSPSHFLLGAVSWSPNFSIPYCPLSIGHHFAIGRDVRLGRRGELHPPAPSVAAAALLEACGFSVCLVEDWRSSTCRFGEPTCLSAGVFAVGGLPLSVRSLRRSVQTAAACARIALSCDVRLCPERYSYVTKTWNIKMSRFARTNHTATTWFTYTRSPPSTGVLPHATHHTDCPQQDRRPLPHRR